MVAAVDFSEGPLKKMAFSVDRVLRKANRLAQNGEADLAIQEYQRVLEKYPQNRLALAGLKTLQRPVSAMGAADSGPSQGQVDALVALFNQGRLQEALLRGEALQKQHPDTPFTPNLLGAVHYAMGRFEQAEASFLKALSLKSDYAIAHNNLGKAQFSLGKLESAVASFTEAVRFNKNYAEAHSNLGDVLNALGRAEEALASCKRSLQIQPANADAHNNLGIACSVLGKREQALTHYNKALQLRPDFAEAHRNVSEAKRYEPGDPHIQQMLQLIERKGLTDKSRTLLNFALGKALADSGDHQQAFFRFAAGNRLCKDVMQYDILNDRALLAKIKSTFSQELPVLQPATGLAGQADKQPVFVLGMPRSGTTLVEQILASHSEIHAAGEIGLLGDVINSSHWESGQISSQQLRSIRERYLYGLAGNVATESIVTDKNPFNYLWIGFILAAMPDAKIVHVTRDARATCWSNFRNFFSGKGSGFTFDLEDVANYYNMYSDLMTFWHTRFPDRIYDVNYETLTEEQESETRKLLEELELDWQDRCLEFHKTKRAVRTASAAQVRQAMYQGSSQDWRDYQEHLGPMLRILTSSIAAQ